MADSPWLVLRQAQEAVNHHRPEEAHRLIEPLIAAGYRRAWKLARVVVQEYAGRASKFIDQHHSDAAWRDLLAAESLNTGEKAIADLRQTLTKLGLSQVRAALAAGRPPEAIHTIGKLNDRGVRHPELTLLDDAAHEWIGIGEMADRGEFLRAIEEVEKLRPKLTGAAEPMERFAGRIRDRHARFKEAVGQLYDAAETRRWRDAVAAADAVLAVAPEHREAKAIRGKAWLAAAPSTADYLGLPEAEEVEPVEEPSDDSATLPGDRFLSPIASVRQSRSSSSAPSPLPKRFLLWVDGVGAYLVCLANRVTFGQATSEGPVDVPLFADVSRLHAEISRDSEGYVIESGKSVLVNGKAATRAVLAPGDRITLGSTCQFLFHKPVAISSTARLELTSGDRLPVAVDGVLLMGNEVMLGPEPEAHVVAPHAAGTVLIYRSKEGLGVRVPGSNFRIDDRPVSDRSPLPLPSVVVGDSFSFAVEPVTARM